MQTLLLVCRKNNQRYLLTNCTFFDVAGLGANMGVCGGTLMTSWLSSRLVPLPSSGSGSTSCNVADLRKIASNAKRILWDINNH